MRLLKLLFATALAVAATLAVAAGFVAVAIGAVTALTLSVLYRRLRPRSIAPISRRPDRATADDNVIDVSAREIHAPHRPD